MKDWNIIIELLQTAPFIVIFYLMWKGGMIKLNGNGKKNGYQAQIDDLKKHAEVANKEMGEMNKRMTDLQADVSFIRGKLSRK